MNSTRNVARVDSTASGSPTWWLVFTRELHELWMGGKAPVLLLIYCVLLGILTYVMASNSELSLIPPQEMVFETVKATLAVGMFISMVIGADSISGERERATLEALLLTPTSRRQIIVGKFLAGISPWPLAFAISIPYMKVMAQGDEVFFVALPWAALVGSITAPAFTAMGMLASFWSNSNKTSLFTGLGLYVLFLVPNTLPGRAQTGLMGSLLQQANPLGATNHFLAKMLVNNRTFAEWWFWLASPVLFAAFFYVMLFWFAGPSLRLEAGRGGKLAAYWGRLLGLAGAASLALLLTAPSVSAQAVAAPSVATAEATPAVAASGSGATESLQISIDMAYKEVKTGDYILYNTVLTNQGTSASRPLCVAMNIINLDAAGDVVDPEDWSPMRTQYLDSLGPGQSATLSWRVNAILDGDYLVYMVAIPEPDGIAETSRPIASSGIHLTVARFYRINPAGVLPYVVGGPVLLILAIWGLYRLRRRQIDTGGDQAAEVSS